MEITLSAFTFNIINILIKIAYYYYYNSNYLIYFFWSLLIYINILIIFVSNR